MSRLNGSKAFPEAPFESASGPPGRVSNRKKRAQVSCTSCRSRKLKCDHSQPCDKCSKRGHAYSCTYINGSSSSRAETGSTRAPSDPAEMQRRLQHLEGLVVALMDGKISSTSGTSQVLPPTRTYMGIEGGPWHTSEGESSNPIVDETLHTHDGTDFITSSFGRINIDKTYVGADHWRAILDDIIEVKGYFEDSDEQLEPDVITAGIEFPEPALLALRLKRLSKAELLASVPQRLVVDRLISRFINSKESVTVIIHLPTFENEYERFWANPQDVSTTWLGLLYCMMGLAVCFFVRNGEEAPMTFGDSLQVMNTFRERTAQCLILANYIRPGQHTIQTLLLYVLMEFYKSNDAQVALWTVLGTTIRLAMHMGYHRDSANYPNLSCLEGEMRRRVWAVLTQLDLLGSFQVGLPRMIRPCDGDAAPPHNLLDEDFNQESTTLPPSRPETDQTPASYNIVKGRLCHVFCAIIDCVSTIATTTYENILMLDRQLQEAHDTTPPFLRIKSTGRSISDQPYIIMQRYTLEVLYQKARCVLHRQYFTNSRFDARFGNSRYSCLDAAMQLLRHQSTLHQDIQPGGSLDRDKWFASSLTNSDFLLAAMIVCLDMCRDEDPGKSVRDPSGTSTWSQNDLSLAIENSYHIWSQSRNHSTEADKACEVLEVMLKKTKMIPFQMKLNLGQTMTGMLMSTGTESLSPIPETPLSQSWLGDEFQGQVNGTQLAHNDATPAQESLTSFNSNEMFQHMAVPSSVQTPQVPMPGLTYYLEGFRSSTVETVESMLYEPSEFDWAIWDDAFQPGMYAPQEVDPSNISESSIV